MFSKHCFIDRHGFSVFESSQSLFWASFGMVDLSSFELTGIKTYTRFWGLLMFGSYSVINVIVLLNLLIAMMSNSYAMIDVGTEIVTAAPYKHYPLAGTFRHRMEIRKDQTVAQVFWGRGYSSSSLQYLSNAQDFLEILRGQEERQAQTDVHKSTSVPLQKASRKNNATLFRDGPGKRKRGTTGTLRLWGH